MTTRLVKGSSRLRAALCGNGIDRTNGCTVSIATLEVMETDGAAEVSPAKTRSSAASVPSVATFAPTLIVMSVASKIVPGGTAIADPAISLSGLAAIVCVALAAGSKVPVTAPFSSRTGTATGPASVLDATAGTGIACCFMNPGPFKQPG